jgi:hypothetical protein
VRHTYIEAFQAPGGGGQYKRRAPDANILAQP